MKTKYFLVSGIALAVMSGCSTQSTQTTSTSTLEDSPEYQALLKSKSDLEMQNKDLRDALEKKQSTVSGSTANAPIAENNSVIVDNSSSSSMVSDLLPPNAVPGHCYARVVIPEQYETQLKKVQVSPELQTVEVNPAEYELVTDEVLVSEE